MEEIIKTANLKKVYGLDTPYPKTALNGVSISVNKGTCMYYGDFRFW